MLTRNFSSDHLDLWIIEDNIVFAKNLAELINQTEGLQCGDIFHSCEEALHELEDESPPDVILMDIGLPGMNGIEGIKRVKMVAPAVQVIMLTVFEDNDNIFQAITAGASGYLHKSATLDEIINALKAILLGGVPMNPHIARKMLEIFKHLSPATSDYGITKREKEVLQLLVDGLSKNRYRINSSSVFTPSIPISATSTQSCT